MSDINGLDPEQQALLASIIGKSSQQGGGGFSVPSQSTTDASAANSGRMLSQSEIDTLIASMSN